MHRTSLPPPPSGTWYLHGVLTTGAGDSIPVKIRITYTGVCVIYIFTFVCNSLARLLKNKKITTDNLQYGWYRYLPNYGVQYERVKMTSFEKFAVESGISFAILVCEMFKKLQVGTYATKNSG